MTLDDNSSIYVGGLPYDISEEALRRVFYVYGSIIAIKIINDRSVGGKCYGFVTFANQRSAMQSIKEMDGKTVNGRIVKVNDVRTRGARPNLNRDSSRHDFDRSIEGDRGRDRGRGDSYDQHRKQEGHRERSQDYDLNRERGHERTRGHDRTRDRYVDEERLRNYSRHLDDVELENGRKRKCDWGRDTEKNNKQQRNTRHHKSEDQDKQDKVHFPRRSRFDDHESRELSLESYNDDLDQGESKLAISNQKLEEFRKEKLEDSLNAAKKLTSRRCIQLTKLHKCYLQMREYDERSKKSEQELQVSLSKTPFLSILLAILSFAFWSLQHH
ncbi:hypothetical protein ACS0TY_021365 [Phlomoides rotata]